MPDVHYPEYTVGRVLGRRQKGVHINLPIRLHALHDPTSSHPHILGSKWQNLVSLKYP